MRLLLYLKQPQPSLRLPRGAAGIDGQSCSEKERYALREALCMVHDFAMQAGQ